MGYANIVRSHRRSNHGRRTRGRGMGEVQLASSLLTPGDVTGAMDTINRAALSLANDVNTNAARVQGSTAGRQFFADWMAFLAEWQRFYATNSSGFSLSAQVAYADGSLVAQIREKAGAFNALEQRYTSVTGATPTQSTHDYVSWSEELSRLGNTGMMWAGIGIVGLLAVGYIVSSVAKIKVASKLALNRRRRR